MTLGHNLARFDAIVVPRPIQDYTNTRVLTMEFVPGRKVTSLGPLGGMDIDGEYLADVLFEAYLQQILADGFFHADPHPGNVLLTPDGGSRSSISAWCLGSPPMQDALLRILLAVSDGRGRDVAEVLIGIGDRARRLRRARLTRGIGRSSTSTRASRWASSRPVASSWSTRACSRRRAAAAAELAMLGKALLNLDQVA